MADIRPAAAADLVAVQTIVDGAYAHYIPRMGRKPGPMLDDYAALIASGQVHVLADGAEIVGLVVLTPESSALLIDNVAVAPSAQGRGYGRMLMDFADEAARSAGYAMIRLYANEAMVENIALYQRLGFVITHRAEENGFRRVYLSKSLGPAPDAK
jgi:ribosomal protein S18 acetylase RimI-like enzyme